MDQINHLQYVTRAMAPEGGGPVDVNSPRAKDLIAILKALHIVVDPTAGWSEMAGHPGNVDVASFEPGIEAAPYTPGRQVPGARLTPRPTRRSFASACRLISR